MNPSLPRRVFLVSLAATGAGWCSAWAKKS